MIKETKPAHPGTKQDEDENKREMLTEANIFSVVGIGASAGGLSAFTKLLMALPTNTGMAFVLVQHLDPKHVSLLPELMTRATAMPVCEIRDGMRIEPNHVYVMPPNYSLALLHNVLHLMPRSDVRGSHLPIDDFLRSLALDKQNNAIGVILSGTASDGTLGMQAIKAEGGITFAQSEDSAEYDGMPRSAIAAGHVDFVLTPEEIARELTRIAQHPYLRPTLRGIAPETPQEDNDINKIFILLRERSGVDFTYYKHNTIRRRIKRRMVLNQVDKIRDYVKLLQAHPKELGILFNDMLINVTSFFRDPDTFEALKNTIFPRLITEDSRKQALRIWVPGCSTGEEVYSLAIVLFEFLGNQINTTPIQIFATDIDKEAIDKARQGIYPPSIAEDVEPERLRRFFIKTAVGYQICKTIRNVCVFAVQNVTKDPPFSRLNLICCRNLFIYLGTALQKKILHTFHYALRPDGVLMLGTSETIGSEALLFSLIDKKSKIYSRKSLPGQTNIAFSAAPYIPFLAFKPVQTQITPAIEVQQVAEKLILEKYGPPSVIIDQNMQILHFRGQTGPYIEPSAGSASLNLLKMARQELVVHLRAAVHHAIKEHCSVRKEGITLHQANSCRNINLQVIPLSSSQKTIAPSYLVLFEPGNELPVQKTSLRAETHSTGNRNQRIKELESELLAEREYMRSVIEEQEGTNEELQSANEEIQSANEELQSTNEELETAKEELQSTNEELTTIIEEQGNRNQELSLVNSDLINLLASIDIAIVILSKNMRIRRFTPAAKLLLNLIDADIGRPIGNIRPNVNFPDMERQVSHVIETAVPKSLEVQDHDGHWYNLRVRPYKALDNQITGVVMIFFNIDHIRNAEQLQQKLQHEQRLAAVVRDANDAVTVQDFTGHILAWNRRATEMYGYREEEALQLNAAILIPDESREEMRRLFAQLEQGEKAPPCETLRRAKNGRLFKIWLTTSLLLNEAGNPSAVALTEREIT